MSAVQVGVKYQTFAHWLQMKKRAREDAVNETTSRTPAVLMDTESAMGEHWMEAVVDSEGKQGMIGTEGSLAAAERVDF